SDGQVISWIHEQGNAAMSQTFQVLRKRIDKFGVAQPNISLDENKGIITVELAGAKDPERVRKYLQSTANLQFWEVYTTDELAMSMNNAFTALNDIGKAVVNAADTSSANKADTTRADTVSAT